MYIQGTLDDALLILPHSARGFFDQTDRAALGQVFRGGSRRSCPHGGSSRERLLRGLRMRTTARRPAAAVRGGVAGLASGALGD